MAYDELCLDPADLIEAALRPHLAPYDHFKAFCGAIKYCKFWPTGIFSPVAQLTLAGSTKVSLWSTCGRPMFEYQYFDLADPASFDAIGRAILQAAFPLRQTQFHQLSKWLQRLAQATPTIIKL